MSPVTMVAPDTADELLAWAVLGGAFHACLEAPPVHIQRGLRGGGCGDSLMLLAGKGKAGGLPMHTIVFTEQPEVSHPHLNCAYYTVGCGTPAMQAPQSIPPAASASTAAEHEEGVAAAGGDASTRKCPQGIPSSVLGSDALVAGAAVPLRQCPGGLPADLVQPRCCSQCIRGLARPEEVSGAESPAFERLDLWPGQAQTSAYICPAGCGEVYCCTRCQSTAWGSHHEVLCPGAADGRGALGRLELYCREGMPSRLRSVAVAPLLLARSAATAVAEMRKAAISLRAGCGQGEGNGLAEHGEVTLDSRAPDADRPGALPFSFLDGFAAMPDGAAEALRGSHQTQLLHRLTCEALSLDALERKWLSLEAFEEALGRVLVNSLVVKPKSPFAVYFSNLRGLSGAAVGGRRQAALDSVLSVAAAEGVDRRDASGHFEARCAVTGAALYRLLSKANHDCSPSCEARTCEMSDHTVDLIAKRSVRCGQELTIAYIDTTEVSCERRQSRLQSNYKFTCTCERCTQEAEQQKEC